MLNNAVKSERSNTEVPVNVLAKTANVSNATYKTRKIICSDSVSKQDIEGIIALYEALVPRKELKLMELRAIHEVFPAFEDIDIDMILKQAFPRFEQTIGIQKFEKVKKYFGIGCKTKQNRSNSGEICKSQYKIDKKIQS